MGEKISMYFYLGNKPYASRFWRYVPRVGDEVMLNKGGERTAFDIKRVVWGIEQEEDQVRRQMVNIEICESDIKEQMQMGKKKMKKAIKQVLNSFAVNDGREINLPSGGFGSRVVSLASLNALAKSIGKRPEEFHKHSVEK